MLCHQAYPVPHVHEQALKKELQQMADIEILGEVGISLLC